MTVFAAGLTAFYSWRLIYKTFHGTRTTSTITRRRAKARS